MEKISKPAKMPLNSLPTQRSSHDKTEIIMSHQNYIIIPLSLKMPSPDNRR